MTTTTRPAPEIMKLDAHSKSRVRHIVNTAKGRWGHGWDLLSDDQRSAAVGEQIAHLLLAQEGVEPDSPLGRLQAVAQAAFQAIAR